ncbi:MAG: gamma-glutamylcyclotransferase family protein [Hyphomonadaceae bacterium]
MTLPEKQSAPLRLFVYGSLRSDAQAWTRRAARPFAVAAGLEGPASIAGRLHAVSWYPALVPARGAQRVRGEVWRINDPAILAVLDAFEGEDYVRERRSVRFDDGFRATAFVYRYAAPLEGVPLIPSGDYVDWVRSQT